jgi:hypothetical protein
LRIWPIIASNIMCIVILWTHWRKINTKHEKLKKTIEMTNGWLVRHQRNVSFYANKKLISIWAKYASRDRCYDLKILRFFCKKLAFFLKTNVIPNPNFAKLSSY